METAHKAHVDAVHPGYGFLAENAEFAQAVIDAGMTWIGPQPATIRALGSKVEARRIAAEVGAPMAPGTTEPVHDPAEVITFAKEHGLPLAIKAVYGGGGRGLKVVHRLEDVREAFVSATHEAELAFGNGDCFIERFLARPRHVEVQILGDGAGNVVAVGTRDCSLQRRNQKLIEEAPAPFLPLKPPGRWKMRPSPSVLARITKVPEPLSFWLIRTARCRSWRSTRAFRSNTPSQKR